MSKKEMIKDVFNSLLKEIHPKKLIKNQCKFESNILYINNEKIVIPENKKIYLLGSGKAVLPMAEAINEIMGEKIEKQLLVGAYENSYKNVNQEYIKSTHPLPSKNSILAAKKLKELFFSLKEDDIVIYLLSGGNSALVELPQDGISLEEFQEATDIMIKGAMPIEAINCVRKHISKVKGGRLASYTKAKTYVLTLSDVIGDDLEAIGSGPLYCDKTTFTDAVNYLNSYKLFSSIPQSIKKYLESGILKKVEDTPKKEAKNVKHFILGSNKILLEKAKELLLEKDIDAKLSNELISGDVSFVNKKLLEFVKDKNGCFIFGGEATVKVKGSGKGGRNQHLVLSFLKNFPKNKNMVFLSAASDGVDGNSDASGAIIDNETLKTISKLNLNIDKYLNSFDSNSFFKQSTDLLIPGPTHNNMLDIVIIYIDK